LELKNREPIKINKKVFIITNAGGAGAILSDYLSKKEFEITQEPLDLLGTASAQTYSDALAKLKSEKGWKSESIIVILTPQSMSQIKESAGVISNFKKENENDVVALFLGSKTIKEADEIFKAHEIPYFNTLEEARERLIF
jgi:acyl-CoA synthetase (NDP forming)